MTAPAAHIDIDFAAMLAPLRYDAETGVLALLDQKILPVRELWIDCRTVDEVARAIRDMVVRGAPAIGCAAAYGMAIAARTGVPLADAAALLRATRPTAVNLFWAIDEMLKPSSPQDGGRHPLDARALAIHADDVRMCLQIGDFGAPLLPPGNVLTHCNAGALATGGYGTALGVIRSAHKKRPDLRVFADETPPVSAGRAADRVGAAALGHRRHRHHRQHGRAPHAARRDPVGHRRRRPHRGQRRHRQQDRHLRRRAAGAGAPDPVLRRRALFDGGSADRRRQRHPHRRARRREVTHIGDRQLAPAGVRVRNPGFDVTPARLISAIITDRGVVRAPWPGALAKLLAAR